MKFDKDKYIKIEEVITNGKEAKSFNNFHHLKGDDSGQRVLHIAYEMVLHAPDGEKFDTLRKAGKLLGGYVAGGLLSEDDAELALKNAIDQRDCDNYQDAYKTISSAIAHGKTEPITSERIASEKQAFINNNYHNDKKKGSTHHHQNNGSFNTSRNDNPVAFGEPEPIEIPLPEVLDIKPEMIPYPFQHWLKDISNRMQVPLDFMAVTAISMISAIVGTRCGVKPKQQDDWLVIPNLWGGVVGSPSMLKTPSLNEVLKPLKRLEADALTEHKKVYSQYEAEKEAFKALQQALKDTMKKAAKGNEERSLEDIKKEFTALAEQEPEAPTLKRYKTNDSTPEKLADLINENPTGIFVFRDELVGLLSSFEKSGHEQSRGFYLEGWTGNGSYTVDRVQRGSIFITNLCLTVFGGIQPDKLRGYLNQILKGDNDGLIQRFQLLVYPDEPKKWKYIDQKPDAEAKNRAYEVIEKLSVMDFNKAGATVNEYESIPYFHFSKEAQPLFEQWFTDLHQKLREEDLHPILREQLAKYRSLMPSLALLFHLLNLADGATDEGGISVPATEQAIQWTTVLESHANRIYHGLGNSEQQAAIELSKKIKRGKLESIFTLRDVQRKGWYLLKDRQSIEYALQELIQADWIVSQDTVNDSGRLTTKYFINPKIKNIS